MLAGLKNFAVPAEPTRQQIESRARAPHSPKSRGEKLKQACFQSGDSTAESRPRIDPGGGSGR